MCRSSEQGTQCVSVVLRFATFIILIIIMASKAYLGRSGEWPRMGSVRKGGHQ